MSLSFLIAFLAALGVDSLFRGSTSAGRALAAVALALAATESLWWVVRQFDVLKSPADSYWIRDWRFLNGMTVLSAMAILVGTLARNFRGAATVSLLVLVATEGTFNNSYPSPKTWDIFAHPVPYVRILQKAAGMERVMPFGALSANLNSAFEIFSLDSLMTINPPRIYELYRRYTEPPYWLFLRDAKKIPPEPVLDRASIGFLAIRDAFPDLVREAQARGYTVRFNDGYVWLFERPTLPRFFFSSEYKVMRAPSALNAVAVAPSREVLIERPPGFPSTANAPGDPEVRVEAYHRNSLALTVDAPRPGLVYASESFFEGWTARVNGVHVPILPANYAFRAVAVPAGRARIEFHYWPQV
jgi:Bacterial membrane protein YfhO